MTDDIAAIRAFLASQNEILTLCGQRIYGEADSPPSGYKPSDGAAICFKRRGGGGDYELVQFYPSYQFKLYGADGAQNQVISPYKSASQLYQALFDVFNHHAGHTIKWARLEVQGQNLSEPSTGWKYVLCFYKVQVLSGVTLL